MSIKVLSLFSGIGAPEKALERMGVSFDLVGFSEIDKWTIKSYCAIHHVSPEKNLGDVTKIDEKCLPDFDMLVGGFPCQSFSVAGKQLGFNDTRGTLFFDLARIAKYKKPKVIFCENVKGLVNHDKGKTMMVILQVLSDIGYTIDFKVLNAKYFDVPQNRERVYIIALRNDLVTSEPWIVTDHKVVGKRKEALNKLGTIHSFNFPWPENNQVTKRLRDVLESDVDEKYYLSKDKTSKLIMQTIANNHRSSEVSGVVCVNPRSANGQQTRQQDRVYKDDGLMTTLQAQLQGRFNVKCDKPQQIGDLHHYNNETMNRVYGVDGISPTLTCPTGGGRQGKNIAVSKQYANGDNLSYCIDANYSKGTSFHDMGKGRRTHIVEKFTTQIKNDNDISRTLRTGGHSSTDNKHSYNLVAQEVRPVINPDRLHKDMNGRRFKNSDDPEFTLTVQDRHGVAIGCYPQYRIRRLTPRECFRLMGFDDEDFDQASQYCSDSQLYKQAGNSIVVNVLESIFKKLFLTLNLK